MLGRRPAAAGGTSAPPRGWQTRQAGRVMLHYRACSFAAQDIDELAARYAEASTAVLRALELEQGDLAPIEVYLVDLPSEPQIPEAAPGACSPADLRLWSVYSPETPGPAPEAELTRLLLDYSLGPAPAGTAFWDDGLAGYLAARSAHPVPQTETGARCRQLLADGLLPPIGELLAEPDRHRTALADCVATSFASYLIERHGLARYRRLLRGARTAGAAFEQTYHLSLTVAARDWRRHLEAVGRGGRASAWTPLRQLLPLARPYWGPGLSILLLMMVGIGFSLALPLAFRFLIDNVLGRRPLEEAIPFVGPRGHVITSSGEQLLHLMHLLVLLSLLYLLSATARLRLNNLINTVSESFLLDLRRKMLAVLVRLPMAYYARAPLADINHRVVQDSVSIQQLLTGTLVPIVAGVLSVVLYAAMLLSLQARLALLALLGLPLLGLIYRLRRRSLRAASRERVRRVADLSAHVNELVGAQLLVKVYTAAPYLLGILGRRLDVHRALNTAFAQESSLLGQVGVLVMNLTRVVVLLAGGYLVIVSEGRELLPGTLVAFYVLLNQLFGPVAQVASASQNLAGASASVERVAELIGQPPEPDPPDGVALGRLRRELRFEDVSFAYDGGWPVLQQLNLAIPAGATVGFVGPTGAGKSSVVQLIPRLYDPTRGRITWDGVDLREARPEALRAQIALVPQDAFLLSASVYENIRFGLQGVSDEQVRRAAQLAQADEFIAGLADGYDTFVGDHGVGLSGGQRQRVALARALLRDPSVLILDEATSALDATTQREVHESLSSGGGHRTLIKIAHRLETVADADVIFVLDGGRLVEQGQHAELLATGGLYARLLEDQVGLLNAAGPPTARQAVRWLARLAPFAELAPAGLEALVGVLTTVERRAGEIVYRQGSAGEELYVVARGRAEALDVDEAGRERVLTALGVGTPLGVAAFVSGLPRMASIRAATDLLLFVLQRPAWQAILEQTAAVATIPASRTD